MTDEYTQYLNLPLPHKDNLLEDDVLRLRQALLKLDSNAAKLGVILASDDTDLDTIKELVAAIQANKTTIDQLLTGKADADAVSNALADLEKQLEETLQNHAGDMASMATAGHVRLATDAEVTAGTVTNKAISPKQLKTTRDAVANPARNDKAASYTSAGTGITNTGFKLANKTDIGEIFGKLDDVENATTGSGTYVTGVTVSVNGKNVKLTQSKGTPGFCSYCGYCSYCTYCACNCSDCCAMCN